MTEIGTRIRIEAGPRRVTGVATEELLSDSVTAKHYQVGRPDALGKQIVLGQEMTYLDWRAFRSGVDIDYYVYHLEEVGINERGEVLFPDSPFIRKTRPLQGSSVAFRTEDRWLPVGEFDTEVEALAFAQTLEKE